MDGTFYVFRPVVDLLSEPKEQKKPSFLDKNRLTQLLFNEEVRVLYEEKEWCFVEAPEQISFRQRGFWAPYMGWIKKEYLRWTDEKFKPNAIIRSSLFLTKCEKEIIFLPFGSRIFVEPFSDEEFQFFLGKKRGYVKKKMVKVIDRNIKRSEIVDSAMLFFGCPYLWGGRSMKSALPEEIRVLTGVDCSGLVNLVFRVCGIDIPRDAHEQFMISKKIKAKELMPGDLIFIQTKKDPHFVEHVMIYCGGGKFIEASKKKGMVTYGSIEDQFGINVSEIKEEKIEVEDMTLFFGRLLENG